MNLLIVSDVYPPYHGGLEKMTHVLAHGMARRGHCVRVLTSHHEEPLPDVEQQGDVIVHRMPLRPALDGNDVRGVLRCVREVAALKKSFQPDLVHIQSEAVSSYFHIRTEAAWPSAMVLTLHGEARAFDAAEGTLLGALLQSAGWISTVSHALLDGLHRSAPAIAARSSVIHNALPAMEDARPYSTFEENAQTILACGRFSSEKGFDVLLRAFQLLLQSAPEARLVLAGDGRDSETLAWMAGELGIRHRVELPGWLQGEELLARMRNAVFQVVPSSYQEPFGLVALEAAMLGMPVVATRVGGLPEIVEDGVTGFLVPPSDPEAMCAAMLRLLRSADLRKRMGEAALRHSACFSVEVMLDRYEAMYHRALKDAPVTTPAESCATA